MVEHLATTARLDVQRKSRFSEQFHEDVVNLTYAVTSDIISKSQMDTRVSFSRNLKRSVNNLKKQFTIVIYDSRVVLIRNLPEIRLKSC